MPDLLTGLPTFPRLSDYFGVWCFEPERFFAMWRTVKVTDFAAHVAAGPPPRVTTTEMVAGTGGRHVAVVKAAGTLMKQQSSLGGTSTVQLRRDIRAAAADPNVSAILLAFDSPGGTVSGTADLAAEVNAARRKKPVWAHVDDLTASAAYWVASQADAVYANSPTALVGSIGTLMTVYDASKAAEREGIEAVVFATGPLKGAGTPGTAISEDQRAYFQGIVEGAQTHFDAAVRKGRGMSAAQLAAVRTGGVFSAEEAVGLKLIDGIRSIDKTLAELASAK